MKKLQDIYYMMEDIREVLSPELTVSLALDGDRKFLMISTKNSDHLTWETGQQTLATILDDAILNMEPDDIVALVEENIRPLLKDVSDEISRIKVMTPKV